MNTPALPYDLEHVRQILESHQLLLGSPLVTQEEAGAGLEAQARWLYEDAPYCLLAHSAEADPRFTYANLTALRCFEYTQSEFIGLPSRLSAEPDRREEREVFVRTVLRQGFAQGYRGRRIAKSGRRFWIEDVTMWNLISSPSSSSPEEASGTNPLRVQQAARYFL